MKKSTVFFLIAILALSLGGIAQAASPWTQETTWKGKAVGKLDFGFKNTLGGWTLIFSEPYNASKAAKDGKSCPVRGGFEGLGRGLVYAAADTVGGILHIATFPITQLDVPLPENGVSLS